MEGRPTARAGTSLRRDTEGTPRMQRHALTRARAGPPQPEQSRASIGSSRTVMTRITPLPRTRGMAEGLIVKAKIERVNATSAIGYDIAVGLESEGPQHEDKVGDERDDGVRASGTPEPRRQSTAGQSCPRAAGSGRTIHLELKGATNLRLRQRRTGSAGSPRRRRFVRGGRASRALPQRRTTTS